MLLWIFPLESVFYYVSRTGLNYQIDLKNVTKNILRQGNDIVVTWVEKKPDMPPKVVLPGRPLIQIITSVHSSI